MFEPGGKVIDSHTLGWPLSGVGSIPGRTLNAQTTIGHARGAKTVTSRGDKAMKKSGIVAALLGLLCIAGSSAVSAQVKGVYWATSGMFGPFPITGLIPTVPKEKQRDITIPVSMWIIDHPKGVVVFDTGINA